MNVWMNEWVDEWMNENIHAWSGKHIPIRFRMKVRKDWKESQIKKRMNEWINEWVDEWMNENIDTWSGKYIPKRFWVKGSTHLFQDERQDK